MEALRRITAGALQEKGDAAAKTAEYERHVRRGAALLESARAVVQKLEAALQVHVPKLQQIKQSKGEAGSKLRGNVGGAWFGDERGAREFDLGEVRRPSSDLVPLNADDVET